MSPAELANSSADNPLQELQLQDYLDILRRRKFWIFLVTLGVFVMGLVIATRLPNIYRAETVIVVDPQQVPESIVPSAAANVLDHLSTIRQLVLSPTRLADLIQRLNLFPAAKVPFDSDAAVASVQKSISVEVSDAGTNQRMSAFRIGYTSRNAQQTAEVANALADMVIQESLKARERQLWGTEEFLDTELQETKKQLEQKEAEVSRIRTQYITELPDSKQFHMEALENLRGQLRASQDRVSRDQNEKMFLQSTLANSNPVVDIDANSEGFSSATQGQIEKLETSLAQLRTRYGEEYPDVRKVESELEALKQKKAREDAEMPKRDLSAQAIARAAKNPVVVSQLAKLDEDIATQNKLQAQLNDEIDGHVSKLEQAPIFEGKIAELMRDYDTLKAHYNSLLDRQISSRMATSLETRQKAEHFQILDVAKVPEKPFAPNRTFLALAALLGGLFAGIGVAVVVDFGDTSVRNEKEAARILGTTVLAGIPEIVAPQQLLMQRVRFAMAVAATVICSAGVGFLITVISG